MFRLFRMSTLDGIFDVAHEKCKRKQATIERLDELYNRHISTIRNTRPELEVCALLKIWLANTWDLNKTHVKLYRVSDRSRDVISYFKNVRNIILKPTEHNYIKRFVKSVQNELDTHLVATPASQAGRAPVAPVFARVAIVRPPPVTLPRQWRNSIWWATVIEPMPALRCARIEHLLCEQVLYLYGGHERMGWGTHVSGHGCMVSEDVPC